MDKYISLAHGNGGRYMRELIAEVFARHLDDPGRDCSLNVTLDAAPITLPGASLGGGVPYITTDGFIVQPLEFPGGDIGSLAGNGTVNDLAVAGATPHYLSMNAFIEEGLEIATLDRIVRSLAAAAQRAGVQVVAGDTKVLPRGEGGGLYLATTGVGLRPLGVDLGLHRVQPGDAVVVSGPIGDHGIAVLLAREDFEIRGDVRSHCGHVIDLARLTGFATRCNNDHGLSPDGTELAISDQSQGEGKSLIYVLPAAGGTPRLVTPLGPSYWHGWSPDGKTLAYCAERNGEYDVYTIPAAGGPETRLTTARGLDDGPDYSPDGEWIYFNSDRTGTMQIWRMRTDGRDQQQLTSDGYADWFPHPSPDGKWVAFLSYGKEVKGHPAKHDVLLRMMPAGGGEAQVLARLFGGQGTINVPSWSPDSAQLAFVSYRLVR